MDSVSVETSPENEWIKQRIVDGKVRRFIDRERILEYFFWGSGHEFKLSPRATRCKISGKNYVFVSEIYLLSNDGAQIFTNLIHKSYFHIPLKVTLVPSDKRCFAILKIFFL